MTANGRRLIVLAKAVISASLIVYLLREIGLSDALRQAQRLSLLAAGIVILLLWAYTFVAALRWILVLRALGLQPGFSAAVRIMFISAFFNQFLPSTIGADAVRIWESHRSGLKVSSAIHSVILERTGHFLAIAALAAVAATAWNGGRLPGVALLALWAALGAVAVLVAAMMALDRIPSRMVPSALRGSATQLASDSRRLFGHAGRLAPVILTVLAGQVILALAVVALARDLGISVSLWDCLALLPAVVLISSLPVSISGWGVREYAMVTSFGYASVPAAGALLVSIALAVLNIVASLPGGLAWLTRRQRISSAPDAPP